MTMREVSIEQYVEQVRNGIHYKGYVKIIDTIFDINIIFDYELVFWVVIADLDTVEPAKDDDELRTLFQVTVKRDNVDIELTNEEYMFFLSIVVGFAVEFYYAKQTRSSNKGKMGEILRGERESITLSGAEVSIGMKSTGTYDFSPEVREMLNRPKFGCTFAL